MTENTQTRVWDTFSKMFPYDMIASGICWDTAGEIAAEIDRLTAERDSYEAGMRFQFDRAEDYKAQRDEARAEAERLRPAAEAWRSLPEDVQIDAEVAAAARAREARK